MPGSMVFTMQHAPCYRKLLSSGYIPRYFLIIDESYPVPHCTLMVSGRGKSDRIKNNNADALGGFVDLKPSAVPHEYGHLNYLLNRLCSDILITLNEVIITGTCLFSVGLPSLDFGESAIRPSV
jgi:hypothetical protein